MERPQIVKKQQNKDQFGHGFEKIASKIDVAHDAWEIQLTQRAFRYWGIALGGQQQPMFLGTKPKRGRNVKGLRR